MKNQITSKILKFAFAFMFVLLASSCSEDNETLDAAALAKDQISSELSAKGGKVVTTAVSGLFTYSSTTVCLGDDLTVSFDNLWGDASDCGETMIHYSLNGTDWFQLDKGTPIDGKYSVTFEPIAGTYSFRAGFVGNAGGCKDGFDNLKSQDNTVLAVVVVAPCGSCDESFSYVANGGNITFTYIPAESVTDANLVFTFAQGAYVSGLSADWTTSGVTKQRTMNLVACQAITWTVILDSNCKGGGQTKANVWTDFTVNSDSKKGSLDNIELSCN